MSAAKTVHTTAACQIVAVISFQHEYCLCEAKVATDDEDIKLFMSAFCDFISTTEVVLQRRVVNRQCEM